MDKQFGILIARFFSIIGHPLLTISLLVVYLSFQEMPEKEAWITSAIIIGGVTLPVIVHNLWKTYKGTYTNFDVSNQKQRNSFFSFAISLMLIVTIICWLTHRPMTLLYSMWLFTLMLLLFYFFNKKWKLSLHAAINFYVAIVLLYFNYKLGVSVFFLALLVAISRYVLKRHSLLEIILGGAIGGLFGWINTLFL